ncbi:hypothetical protein [Nocardia sp. R7R-8]|uniref:hypothetical protein n=1 Tax=Nocardia sp. R7R-8 TaxID=3459304 RepID=UPI00403E09A1
MAAMEIERSRNGNSHQTAITTALNEPLGTRSGIITKIEQARLECARPQRNSASTGNSRTDKPNSPRSI